MSVRVKELSPTTPGAVAPPLPSGLFAGPGVLCRALPCSAGPPPPSLGSLASARAVISVAEPPMRAPVLPVLLMCRICGLRVEESQNRAWFPWYAEAAANA